MTPLRTSTTSALPLSLNSGHAARRNFKVGSRRPRSPSCLRSTRSVKPSCRPSITVRNFKPECGFNSAKESLVSLYKGISISPMVWKMLQKPLEFRRSRAPSHGCAPYRGGNCADSLREQAGSHDRNRSSTPPCTALTVTRALPHQRCGSPYRLQAKLTNCTKGPGIKKRHSHEHFRYPAAARRPGSGYTHGYSSGYAWGAQQVLSGYPMIHRGTQGGSWYTESTRRVLSGYTLGTLLWL